MKHKSARPLVTSLLFPRPRPLALLLGSLCAFGAPPGRLAAQTFTLNNTTNFSLSGSYVSGSASGISSLRLAGDISVTDTLTTGTDSHFTINTNGYNATIDTFWPAYFSSTIVKSGAGRLTVRLGGYPTNLIVNGGEYYGGNGAAATLVTNSIYSANLFGSVSIRQNSTFIVPANNPTVAYSPANGTNMSGFIRQNATFSMDATSVIDTNGVDVDMYFPVMGFLNKTGAGTMTLHNLSLATNVVNNYAELNIRGGTVKPLGDRAFASGTLVSISQGATFDLANENRTAGRLSGAGNVALGSGSLTVDQSADSEFSGVLSGTGGLTKMGTGRLVLSGDNINTGTIQVSSGILQIGNGGTSGSLASPSIVNDASLRFHRADSFSYAGVISGSGSLTKLGAGTFTLTGANTYTGDTTISGGDMRINNTTGSAFGTGAVTVEVGATLSGSGGFTGALLLNGTLSPGNSPGLLSIGSGSVLAGVTLIELGGTVRGFTYDAINVTGSGLLTLGGTLDVVLYEGWTPTGSATFQLFQATSIGGSFAQISLPTIQGYVWDTARLETEGTLDLTAIPEPGAYGVLAGVATLACAGLRRRRLRTSGVSGKTSDRM